MIALCPLSALVFQTSCRQSLYIRFRQFPSFGNHGDDILGDIPLPLLALVKSPAAIRPRSTGQLNLVFNDTRMQCLAIPPLELEAQKCYIMQLLPSFLVEQFASFVSSITFSSSSIRFTFVIYTLHLYTVSTINMRFIATKLPLLLAASATIVVGESTTTGSGSVSTSSTKCAAQK